MEDEYIGDEDVDAILRELDISGIGDEYIGDDDDDDEGDDDDGEIGRRGRRRKRARRMMRRLMRRRIAPLSREGRPRQFPLLCTRSEGLADATAATLTGTADRRAVLQALFIDGNSALGVRLFGFSLTGLTINGRNAVIGTGFLPISVAFGDFAQSAEGDGQWYLGVIEQGGTANIELLNNSGAAADVYAGFRAETTDG